MTDKPASDAGPVTSDDIFHSLADGILTVDRDFVITFFNQAAGMITGIPAREALGKRCSEILRSDACGEECPLRKAIEKGLSLIRYPIHIAGDGGEDVTISVTASPLKDSAGGVIGGILTFRDFSLIEELHRRVQATAPFEDIISGNRRMKEIIAVLPRIAQSDSTVLIQGESGTGKDLVARAIHKLSPRKKGPIIVVNCGALPDTLLESELFGYEAGAFTDARKNKPGRFAQADTGSIFLDEIGDVSPALQTRLLRVIQEKTFEPLGSTRTLRSNVRVIAATNKDLAEEVRSGRFRQDLYYRINVFQITLPPLRERREDILTIADSFIDRMNRITGKNLLGLSPRAIELFMSHDWPGNIRELENVIEHAFILCSEGLILCEHLPGSLTRRLEPPAAAFVGMTLAQIEAAAILDALRRHGGNRSAAARELGVDKTTIWRKMKKIGLKEPSL